MATLTGKKIKNTYDALLKLSDNDNLTTTAKQVTDGFGNNAPLWISTTQIGIGVTPETGYDLHVYSDAKVGGNLTITADLTVNGTTTTVDTDTLRVEDPLIELARLNTSADSVDIGFYGKYHPSGTTLYSGLFRDAGDDKYKLFKDLQTEPTTTVNTSGTGYARADLVVSTLEFDSLKDLGESITITKFVDEADGISSNDNDTTIPTSAAVKDYVDNNSSNTLAQVLVEGNTTGGTNIDVSAGDDINLTDTSEIHLGDSADLVIKHNGNQGVITNNTGTLQFVQNKDDGDIKFFCDDGSGGTENYLQIDGGEQRIKVFNEMRFSDNVELRLGTGNDLKIYHDGSDSYIDEGGTGGLLLESNSYIYLQTSNGAAYTGKFINGGAVELYHNGTKKFETSSTGVSVIGNITIPAGNKLRYSDNSFMTPENNTSGAEISTAGTFIVKTGTTPTLGLTVDASQNATFAGDVTIGTGIIKSSIGGDIAITQGSIGLRINDAASAITPTTATLNNNDAIDLGVNNIRWRNLYLSGNATIGGNVDVDGGELKISGDYAKLFFEDTAGTDEDAYIVNNANGLFFGKTNSPSGSNDILSLDLSNKDATFAGNVGIGTSSPSHALEVTSAAYDQVEWTRTSGVSGYLYSDSAGAGIYSGASFSDAGIYLVPDTSMDFRVNGSQRMYINSSGNVGIGTTSPASKLEVYGGGNTFRMDSAGNTSKTFLMRNVNTATAEIKTDGNLDINIEDANRTMRFLNGDTERMRIASDGKVGIGTTSPQRELHVELTSDHCIISAVSGTSRLAGLVLGDTDDDDKGAIIYNNASDYLYFNSNGSERMRIESNGRIAIGNTSAQAHIHVNSGTANTVAMFESTDTATTIKFKDSTGTCQIETRDDFRFSTSGGEKVRIENGGNVGIGTTSPSDALEIYGDTKGIIINNTAETDAGIMMRDSADGGQQASIKYGSGDNDLNFFNGDGTTIRFRIDNTGDAHLARYLRHQGDTNSYLGWNGNDDFRILVGGVQMLRYDEGISGTDYTQMMDDEFRLYANGDFHADGDLVAYSTTVSSDKRLKKDIKPIDNALDIVDKLQGVHFNWKENDEKSIGYIAQDVEKVLPEMVTEKNHFDKGEFKTVNYAAMVSIMGEAIKELRAEVEQLKKQIK